MTTAARILKSDPSNMAARRVRLTDLSEAAHARCDSSAFEAFVLPPELIHGNEFRSQIDLQSALAALQSAAEQLHAERDHWLDQCRQETVQLGIAIAEHLLHRILTAQPEAVFDLVRSALEWSTGADRLRVRLHPADAELIASASETLLRDTCGSVEFLPDDSLARGDCLVETPNGQIDARRQVILQRIADELLAE